MLRTGYAFARRLDREQLTAIAEPIPGGESVAALITIAKDLDIAILAGLF